ERALRIMNPRLRYEAKYGVAAQKKTCGNRHEQGCQNPPCKFALNSFRYHRRECAIGGGDQHSRKTDAFGFVTVERRRSSAAAQHLRKFPAEIDGIPDSRIHSLTAGRAVNVSCISQ